MFLAGVNTVLTPTLLKCVSSHFNFMSARYSNPERLKNVLMLTGGHTITAVTDTVLRHGRVNAVFFHTLHCSLATLSSTERLNALLGICTSE